MMFLIGSFELIVLAKMKYFKYVRVQGCHVALKTLKSRSFAEFSGCGRLHPTMSLEDMFSKFI